MWVREKIINIAEFLHPQHIDTANLSTLISGDFCMHRSPLFPLYWEICHQKTSWLKMFFIPFVPQRERPSGWLCGDKRVGSIVLWSCEIFLLCNDDNDAIPSLTLAHIHFV